MNREIIYERNLSGSYMKIPAGIEAEFDEKMMLRRKLPGLLPVEKCYVDGSGQYWYNISGVQSLDTYCRFKNIGMAFVEQLIISICSGIEILEQNLLDQNTILLEPELIFIANQTQEFVFAIYPGNKDTVETAFQSLMEYLLTKIDHKDMEAVHAAYGIYEKTLAASYSLSDIRDGILYARKPIGQGAGDDSWTETAAGLTAGTGMKAGARTGTGIDLKGGTDAGTRGDTKGGTGISFWKGARDDSDMGAEHTGERKKLYFDLNRTYQGLQEKLVSFKESILTFGRKKSAEKKPEPSVVYPDERDPEEMPQIHPTVCLRQYGVHSEGLLLYEGKDALPDIYLEKEISRIGKDPEADIVLDRETISRFHAKIRKENEEYYIEDLNSTNGTYVNDEILPYKEMRKLKTNDQIRFANIKFRFL